LSTYMVHTDECISRIREDKRKSTLSCHKPALSLCKCEGPKERVRRGQI
jgi:hypothetical protein